jgi:hypothetical protein
MTEAYPTRGGLAGLFRGELWRIRRVCEAPACRLRREGEPLIVIGQYAVSLFEP